MTAVTPVTAGGGGEPAGQHPPGTSIATAAFQQFLTAVVQRQVGEWLPAEGARILDLSRRSAGLLTLMSAAGHRVLHAGPPAPAAAPLRRVGKDRIDDDTPGTVHTVCADTHLLGWLADATVDAVVAEGGALGESLAAELTVEEIHRVLRPGGQLLASVDSLVTGLAKLAGLGRWAELADVPAADVVLVPESDGGATRCFWPEELHEMLTAAGFEVEWIRPRTVLSPETVTQALLAEPGRLAQLVETELALAQQRQGESIGAQLVASARKPG